jgi:hypothetical protein
MRTGADPLAKTQPRLYIIIMSYLTVEVEIEHGRIIPSEPKQLPENGKGLLTIFPSANGTTGEKRSPLAALEALQKHLQLNDRQVDEWITTVRDARR